MLDICCLYFDVFRSNLNQTLISSSHQQQAIDATKYDQTYQFSPKLIELEKRMNLNHKAFFDKNT